LLLVKIAEKRYIGIVEFVERRAFARGIEETIKRIPRNGE
jgi:hypothetical protein